MLKEAFKEWRGIQEGILPFGLSEAFKDGRDIVGEKMHKNNDIGLSELKKGLRKDLTIWVQGGI